MGRWEWEIKSEGRNGLEKQWRWLFGEEGGGERRGGLELEGRGRRGGRDEAQGGKEEGVIGGYLRGGTNGEGRRG